LKRIKDYILYIFSSPPSPQQAHGTEHRFQTGKRGKGSSRQGSHRHNRRPLLFLLPLAPPPRPRSAPLCTRTPGEQPPPPPSPALKLLDAEPSRPRRSPFQISHWRLPRGRRSFSGQPNSSCGLGSRAAMPVTLSKEPRHARAVEIRKPSSFVVSLILLAEIWVL
jgi:hypothetical protein